MPYPIFDKERRQIVVACIHTYEQANAKLAELVESDPEPKATCAFSERVSPSARATSCARSRAKPSSD